MQFYRIPDLTGDGTEEIVLLSTELSPYPNRKTVRLKLFYSQNSTFDLEKEDVLLFEGLAHKTTPINSYYLQIRPRFTDGEIKYDLLLRKPISEEETIAGDGFHWNELLFKQK